EDLLEPAGQIDATTGVVRPWKVLELTAARIEPGRGHVRAYTGHAGIDGAGNTVVTRQRRVNAPGRRAQVHGARIPSVARDALHRRRHAARAHRVEQRSAIPARAAVVAPLVVVIALVVVALIVALAVAMTLIVRHADRHLPRADTTEGVGR